MISVYFLLDYYICSKFLKKCCNLCGLHGSDETTNRYNNN